jgi:tRNA threonylcarbamoyladenosine biosynthesis protein TsaE
VILVFETFSPEETVALGARLGRRLEGGQVVVLDGALGTGKTHFVKGLAQGLGCRALVTSPTFTLLHLYEGERLNLAHFDVYRLAGPEEMEGLGYEEYFFGPGVTVIEWGSLIRMYLPERYIQVRLSDWRDPSRGEGRRIEIETAGGEDLPLLKELGPYACAGD